jgi:hypothetical protein
MVRRAAIALGLLLVVASAFAAPASAETYCVGPVGGCQPNLQAALDTAKSTTTVADTILLGAGTFSAGAPAQGFRYEVAQAANTVEVVGSGRDQTTITGNPLDADDWTTLWVQGPGPQQNRVRDVRIEIPGNANPSTHRGLLLGSGVAERVDVVDAGAGDYGIWLESATVQDCTITVRAATAQAILSRQPGDRVERCTMRGSWAGIGGIASGAGTSPDTVVRDVDIEARYLGVSTASGNELSIENARILVTESDSGDPATALRASDGSTIDARHVSALGPSTGSGSLVARAGNIAASSTARVDIANSVLRRFGTGLQALLGASVAVSFSNLPAMDEPSSGTITRGDGVIDADPRFVGEPTGDLRLQAGSPSLDTASEGAASPPLDLLGTPRPQDGNGDGLARSDMGAYELATPSASALPSPPVVNVGRPDVTTIPSPNPPRDRRAPTCEAAGEPLSPAANASDLLRGRLRARLFCDEPATLTAVLTATRTEARRIKLLQRRRRPAKPVTIGRGSVRATRAGRAVTLTVRLSRRTRARLRRAGMRRLRRARVTLTIVARDAAGNRKTTARRVRLR